MMEHDERECPGFGFPRLDFFTVTSTLDVAREQACYGAPHGTLITASHQIAGRGRRGAAWLDEAGSSALMTFVVRSDLMFVSEVWRLPFLASLSCVRAFHGLGVVDARVKWPNDLVIGGAKVGGLMIESVNVPRDGLAYLLGIGINVTQDTFTDSAEFAFAATSLRIAARQAGRSDFPTSIQVIAAVALHLVLAWRAFRTDAGDLMGEWRKHQITGHMQRGIALATGEVVSGAYRDVRPYDGAALIDAPNVAELVPVMPIAA